MKKKAFLLIGMGFEAVILLWIFIYLGQILDSRLGSKGLAVSGFVILAITIWFYQLFKLFQNK